MIARVRVLAALGVVLATGCPASTRPPSTTTPGGPATASSPLGPEVLLTAKGQGAGENEAYAAARQALAAAVLGDAAWADVVAVDVHRRDVDPQRVTASPGGPMEVELGVSRERVAELLDALAEGEPAPQGPEAWREPLTLYLRAHAAARACLQRRALLAAACEVTPTTEVDAAVAELGRGLELIAAQPDGVPVDARGRALRSPTALVRWRGALLPGLPLRVEADDPAALALDQAMSDERGHASVTLADGAAMPPLRLLVDGAALLGPHHDAAPRGAVRLEPRAVGLGRWALVVVRGAAAGASDDAGATVGARLRGGGMGEPQSLPARDVAALRDAPADRRTPRITALADAMQGRLDLVLVLSYDTRFASRMGGGRLWYEAEGTLEAVDAWTGQVRAKASTRVEADGVGDERAAAAARRKLAEALAADVLASLRAAGPR